MNTTINEVITLTPERAAELLKYNTYKHQRALRKNHVAFLANEMTNGSFTQATVGLAKLVEETYLVNGQHTLNAVVKSGVSISNVNLIKYLVYNDAELANLYCTIDRNLPRGNADVLATQELSERFGLSKSKLGFLAAATKYLIAIKSGNTTLWKQKINDSSFVSEIISNMDAFKSYEEVAINSPIKVSTVFRQEVLALAILTIQNSQLKASVFWQGVIHDDGLAKNDIRKKANRHLTVNKTMGGGNAVGITRNQSFLAMVSFWNAWNKAKLTPNDDGKIQIALTPIWINSK